MRRRRLPAGGLGRTLLAAAGVAVAACATPPAADGPRPLEPGTVWAVRIASVPPEARPVESIVDPAEVEEIARSEAFATGGWVATDGRPLAPRFRLDLLGDEGARASYWLGTESYPPRFPCYALCSGWWIAPASRTREVGAPVYKGLPEAVSDALLDALDLP